MKHAVEHYFGGGSELLNMHERLADLLLIALSASFEDGGDLRFFTFINSSTYTNSVQHDCSHALRCLQICHSMAGVHCILHAVLIADELLIDICCCLQSLA